MAVSKRRVILALTIVAAVRTVSVLLLWHLARINLMSTVVLIWLPMTGGTKIGLPGEKRDRPTLAHASDSANSGFEIAVKKKYDNNLL